MKAIIALFLCAVSVLADEGVIRVFSIAHTNSLETVSRAKSADLVYAKDEFTRDGQTNLIRILRLRPEGWAKVFHFYHAGQLVGNFVSIPGESVFNSEAGLYCTSLKYGPGGEIRSARIGDQRGVLVDEFIFTNGSFCPIEGPLRQNGLMKPKFGDEAKFIKEAAESEAQFKKRAPGNNGPTSQ